MQKISNIILKAALAVFSAVLATGCISEKFDMPDNLQSVMVMLEVKADDIQTKAEYVGAEAATDAEKQIKELRIYAYYGDRLAGYYHREDATVDAPIYIDLRLPETGTHNVDFYVIANEDAMTLKSPEALTENMSKSQLEAITFSEFQKDVSTHGLPMYGKETASINVEKLKKDDNGANMVNTTSGHEQHLWLDYEITIPLGRPLAKISIYAAKVAAADNVTINSIKALRKGTREYGYLFPTTTENLQAINPHTTFDFDVVKTALSVDKAMTVHTSAPADYTPVINDFYWMEVPYGSNTWNVAVEGNALVLEVDYTAGGITRKESINMPVMNRNCHHKVFCLISAEGVLSINYIVADWEDATMWTERLNFAYPTYSDLLPEPKEDYTSKKATMSTSTPFTGYFRLTAPAKQKWTPGLINEAAGNYEIKVYYNNAEVTDWANLVAAEGWYRIEVSPTSQTTIGKSVKLAIAYQPNFQEYSDYLMINNVGSGGYVWLDYSDTVRQNDSDYVLITQIN